MNDNMIEKSNELCFGLHVFMLARPTSLSCAQALQQELCHWFDLKFLDFLLELPSGVIARWLAAGDLRLIETYSAATLLPDQGVLKVYPWMKRVEFEFF